ncbi:MAG: DUF523 and DUF1722 domain-containing protein [Myxococcota bacterium]|nr:DUF523 and DUF1722 domain-containing protein [Myxococcota bacterium]
MEKIRLGISSCLLGEPVRYDGGHKLDRFLRDSLGAFVNYVPVCPEVECGLAVPREAMRLVGDPDQPRLVTSRTRVDLTEQMTQWAERRVKALEAEHLDGFIFKSKSPSSGMERVKVYSEKGMPRRVGRGIFARMFMDHFPLVPVEEEGRLNDLLLRENFIERIFVCARFRRFLETNGTPGQLVAFHTQHKLLILSHSPKHYQALGRLVAGTEGKVGKSKKRWRELLQQYQQLLMAALRLRATPAKQTNVMHHAMGYFKRDLSTDEKQELLALIDSYKEGDLPLIVPITLLNHYVRKYKVTYLQQQIYLSPHPLELKLRNHA